MSLFDLTVEKVKGVQRLDLIGDDNRFVIYFVTLHQNDEISIQRDLGEGIRFHKSLWPSIKDSVESIVSEDCYES
jgi:hypothetical protein